MYIYIYIFIQIGYEIIMLWILGFLPELIFELFKKIMVKAIPG